MNPCEKGVFQQIKNTTVCDFANILAKLDANDSIYNTSMTTAYNNDNNGNQITAPANTKKNSPFNYTIYINPDYSGKTKLFNATLILHEMVHAYFMSLFDDYFNGNPSNQNAYDDFSYLFNYYVTLNHPTSINPADIQHQQMATDYANAIAAALKEYAISTGTSSTYPNLDQICSDLAYGSLSDAPDVFNSLFPIGSSERQRILNRYASEQTGSAIGQGTPNEQTPIGQPCN